MFEETKILDGELLRLNEDFLADQAAILKNKVLLNDCKPTSKFLNMEKRKGGYCNLTKLRVQRTDDTTKLQVEEEIFDPSKIRDEMKTFYQNIFNRQEVKEGMEAIDEFLKIDNNDNPYQELPNRRIYDEIGPSWRQICP